jgi:hypothetical protein
MYKMIKREKFHNMNATIETVRFDDGMTVKRLVSYDSVVCDVDLETGTIFFYPRFQYSPTTVRQLTRFLDEYAPLDDGRWSIGLVRELRAKADSDGFTKLDIYGVFFSEYVLGTSRRW